MQETNNLLIQKILNNAKRYPNKIILTDKLNSITFSQLILQSQNYSNQIKKIKSNFVPIIVTRNVQTVVAILSIVFAKKVFCPISSTFPEDRIKLLIKKLKSKNYINCTSNNFKISGRFILKNKNIISKKKECISTLNSKEVFYLLFTSGTTGLPKGVKLTYSNILNTILWSKDYLNSNNQKLGIATQFSFDISMFDLFYGLFFSVPMHIFSNPSNPFDSFYEIRKNKITSIFSVPTFFANFVRYGIVKKQMKSLKRIISGGDFFSHKDILSWRNNQRKTEIFNVWGPTETSIVNSMYKITNKDNNRLLKGRSIPVGVSHKKMEIVILKDKKKQSRKQEGEICMVGECVSKGYIGSTKEKKNYIKFKNKRAYLTGDLGYIDDKGYLHIVGRKDNTIKISGYRIDTLEIQNIVNKIPNVNNSLILSFNLFDIKTLCLAIETSTKLRIDVIKKILQSKLPAYSIPKKIFFFRRFPLTNNNKIDEKQIENKIKQN